MTRRADLAEFLLARIAEDQHFGTHDRHLAKRWDAECEAKRKIVERHARQSMRVACQLCWPLRCELQILALPYADHPDYREEWRT